MSNATLQLQKTTVAAIPEGFIVPEGYELKLIEAPADHIWVTTLDMPTHLLGRCSCGWDSGWRGTRNGVRRHMGRHIDKMAKLEARKAKRLARAAARAAR